MVRKGMSRGLVREKLNSDFMRLQNYRVIDSPILKPSDNLSSLKRPDHRINGKIFDSYAAKMKVTVESWTWDEQMVNPRTEMPFEFDALSPLAQKQWRGVEGEFIKKGIASKVKAGQTRNILLNMADIQSGGELCQTEFATLLNEVENLESVISIYPKKKVPYRGYSKGLNEEWENYFPADMEAVEWKHGQTEFHQLQDGESIRDPDQKNDLEDPNNPDPRDEPEPKDNPSYTESRSNASTVGGFGGLLSSAIGLFSGRKGCKSLISWGLSCLGIFALTSAISFSFITLSSLLGNKKKPKTESGKSAVAIYAWYMSPVIGDKSLKLEDLDMAHHDIKVTISQLLCPANQDDRILEILDSEYNDVIIKFQGLHFLEMFLPFCETIVLFLYIVSRFVSKFISIATKNESESHNLTGVHVALLLASSLGQQFLPFIFLEVFCGPLKFIYYFCMVSLTIRLVNALTGIWAPAYHAISYTISLIWEKTERHDISSSKYTLPKRCVVVLIAMVVLSLLSSSFVNISTVSTIFKAPVSLFTTFLPLVGFFKYFELLVRHARFSYGMLFLVLIVYAAQMAWPNKTQFLNYFLDKKWRGLSANGMADGLWKEMEMFINLKTS